MEITYFYPPENRLIKARLLEIRPRNALVFDLEKRREFLLSYEMLNVQDVDTDVAGSHAPGGLTAHDLKVGELVGFCKDGKDIVGIIKRLNPKTVTLVQQGGRHWRVSYVFLYRVEDIDANFNSSNNVIDLSMPKYFE